MPLNHYSVLNLPPSAAQAPGPEFQRVLRRAYKDALLRAHPDKKRSTGNATNNGGAEGGVKGGVKGDVEKEGATIYSIDDVKEALAVLSDSKRRVEFERWIRVHGEEGGRGSGGERGEGQGRGGEEFVLGLEALDLSDFEAGMPFVRIPTPASNMEDEDEGDGEGGDEGGNGDGHEEGDEEQMIWTRGCRCGDEQGFRILERELEEAEERGEREVLVGCEGCSLWVRVGFDVEVG